MKRQSTLSDIDRNALQEESVFLRIHELQNGLVQLTDATTAYRMVTEFGNDIRYIAPWKKWVVWNGTHWEGGQRRGDDPHERTGDRAEYLQRNRQNRRLSGTD